MNIFKSFLSVFFLILSVHSLPASIIEITIHPSDDPAAVQSKVRTLPPGSTVRLLPGRHTNPLRFSGLRGTPQNPIRITADIGATLEGTYDKNTDTFTKGAGIIIEKSSDILIEKCSISGFERGITLGACNHVTIKENNIHDIGNYGVMSFKSDNIVITANVIERSYREHGIYISASGQFPFVTDNTIRDTHINGIHVNGAIVNPNLSGNRLERTGLFPTKEGGAAITLVGGTIDPVVERNTFNDIYGQGITLDAPNAVIRDNTFASYAWSGILGLPKALNLNLANNVFAAPKTIPLQLSAAILPSLTASGQRYASGLAVCQERESKRTHTLEAWREMGKDAR